MTRIFATKGDITQITGMDAIVNAASSSLLGGGGVDGAIHKAAGQQLLEECQTLNGCKTGEAKITSAYDLPCTYVIHTVGPIWEEAGDEDELLCNAYYNSLSLAMENGIKKIAFPSISTGIYGFPLQRAARLAINTCMRFVEEHPHAIDEIQFVLHDDRTYLVYDMENRTINSGLGNFKVLNLLERMAFLSSF